MGAVHWYATLKLNNPEKSFSLEVIEIEHPLTAKEVKVLNKEREAEGYMSGFYRVGEMTRGFNTEAEAIAAGIKYFVDNYKGILYKGEYAGYSAWKEVLIAPPELSDIVNKMNKISNEFRTLNGYECHPKNIEQLDNEWFKLLQHLEFAEEKLKNT